MSVFAAGSWGNVPPTITLSGDNTALHFPMGIAVDSDGNVYVSNMGNGRNTGSIAVYPAGSKGGTAPVATVTGGNIEDLRAIALDSSRNIYVSNYGDNTLVYRHGSNGDVLPAGIISRDQVGSSARGIAVDSSGKVYMTIASSDGGGAVVVFPPFSKISATTVATFDAGQKELIELSAPPSSTIKGRETRLINPRGIAVDSAGYVYVANEGDHGHDDGSVTIYSAGSDGNVAPIATIGGPLSGLRHPDGIALGPPIAAP